MDFEFKQQKEMEMIKKRIHILKNVHNFFSDTKNDFLADKFFKRRNIFENKKEILNKKVDK